MNLNHTSKRKRKDRAHSARRLIFILLGRGMKIGEIAEALSVSDRTVKRWLYEKRVPHPSTMKKIEAIVRKRGNE